MRQEDLADKILELIKWFIFAISFIIIVRATIKLF